MSVAPERVAFPLSIAAAVGAVAAVAIYLIQSVAAGSFSAAALVGHAVVGSLVFIVLAQVRNRFA